jgi:hypothetical protein
MAASFVAAGDGHVGASSARMRKRKAGGCWPRVRDELRTRPSHFAGRKAGIAVYGQVQMVARLYDSPRSRGRARPRVSERRAATGSA